MKSYLDLLEADLLSFIFDKVADDYETSIKKATKRVEALKNKIKHLDILSSDDEEHKYSPSIFYENICYCIPEYLYDVVPIKRQKAIILKHFVIDDTFTRFKSSILHNPTYFDLVVEINKINNKMLAIGVEGFGDTMNLNKIRYLNSTSVIHTHNMKYKEGMTYLTFDIESASG